MKSICIKSLDINKIKYILDRLENSNIDVIISYYRFKIYDNLIIHDKDELNHDIFLDVLSYIIKNYIEFFLEEEIIYKIVEKNYFYLSNLERKYICEITKKVLELPDEKIGNRNVILFNLIRNYVYENKKIYLDGFFNFRIKEYKDLLEKIVEVSVISYLDLTTF